MIELEELRSLLMEYFDIGDSYVYNLTRVKSSFGYGTVKLDDFEEFTEENIDDIINFIHKKMKEGKS